MDLNKIQELKAALGMDKVEKHLEDQAKAAAAEKQKAADAERTKAEQARIKQYIEEQTSEMREGLNGALEIIETLSKKLEDQDIAGFSAKLEEMQDKVASKSEEIAQLLNVRDGISPGAVGVKRGFWEKKEANLEEEAEKAVFLGMLLGKDIFETDFGSSLQKTVNQSSSIEVSSDSYETVFSTNLLRDIQKRLVVGNLFGELPMSAANITMPIEPASQSATWVGADTYGKNTTTGNEIKVALTEITFRTFKLAAKVYITDETTEDAIMPLLPVLRRHLVESHANAIEQAFMNGDGTGKPMGLLKLAAADSNKVSTEATHTGDKLVTALMLHKMRRKLGTKGLRMGDLTLIVSEDAYYDLLEDPAFADVDQVGASALKLQGQLGRVYGMPVVVSEWFPAKASGAEFALLVYRPDFIVPRQRQVTIERERRASEQRDAYYATQRLNLTRFFEGDNVASAAYA